MSTIVHYYIPEDKEEQDKLNAFLIYKPTDQLRISDIRENFPLPGEYYFRFKFKFQNKNVWIDFNNPDATLPLYDEKVIMKVTRINWGEDKEDNNSSKKNGMDSYSDLI
jgi:hypothetical protein